MSRYVWHRSSYCQEGEACIHIARDPADRTVRLTESADPARVILTTTRQGFTALLDAVKENHV